MSASIRRRLADLVCRASLATLPHSMRSWGWAVRCETAGIPDDTRALLFAFDSLRGLMPRAAAIHMSNLFASLSGDRAPVSGGSAAMNFLIGALRRPRALGIACATGAVLLGLAYMAAAGAPALYLAINGGALAIGLALLLICGSVARTGADWSGGLVAAIACALLATTWFGHSADGATRWVKLGGLALQPSLILLPVGIVTFARSRGPLATAGMILAAAALALQPDRAMAGMLAAGLAVLAVVRPGKAVLTALSASILGFAATFVRADALATSPYVDQILFSSFDVHALAGMAVLTGAFLLLVPAILGSVYDAANRETYLVFGAVWSAAIAAAALGNYPTPLVGFGGSAIIGYALSLVTLPEAAATRSTAHSNSGENMDAHPHDRHLRLELA